MPAPTQLATPCCIVSDHHFGAVPVETEKVFLGFLEQLPERAASLVINGDLFDFWFEWKHVIPRAGYRTLAALAALADKDFPILWIGGNHDCWGGDVLRQDAGVHYMLGAWQGRIGAWNARIEHGDGLREVEDRRYRALRAVIRNPLAIRGMRLLHPDFGTWLASRSSNASRVHRARDHGAGLRNVAARVLEADNPPDLYVLGHTHVPALEQFPHRRVYANPGSWSDGGSHLIVNQDSIELRGSDGSAEVHSLHVVNR